ncbi:hypothetical protein HaLaN_00960 [Haematococcus lacustris]|uniref:Uncharacterized protein n=1 Tax=Haematococcus lacustris TaxID=44745 RepID=A0A699YAG7_HAELA|nr:hypothetical protein HaLaN_00960 [Haematococcus lacustris]
MQLPHMQPSIGMTNMLIPTHITVQHAATAAAWRAVSYLFVPQARVLLALGGQHRQLRPAAQPHGTLSQPAASPQGLRPGVVRATARQSLSNLALSRKKEGLCLPQPTCMHGEGRVAAAASCQEFIGGGEACLGWRVKRRTVLVSLGASPNAWVSQTSQTSLTSATSHQPPATPTAAGWVAGVPALRVDTQASAPQGPHMHGAKYTWHHAFIRKATAVQQVPEVVEVPQLPQAAWGLLAAARAAAQPGSRPGCLVLSPAAAPCSHVTPGCVLVLALLPLTPCVCGSAWP